MEKNNRKKINFKILVKEKCTGFYELPQINIILILEKTREHNADGERQWLSSGHTDHDTSCVHGGRKGSLSPVALLQGGPDFCSHACSLFATCWITPLNMRKSIVAGIFLTLRSAGFL